MTRSSPWFLFAVLAAASVVPAAPAALASGAYPWLEAPSDLSLETRFPAPEGFRRVSPATDSYPAWLRGLPLARGVDVVRSHDGERLERPAAAVVLMDVGRGDLQQCADSAIRLHAEYLWASGKADEAAYHFTSGDRSSWDDWRAGERFAVAGSRVERVSGAPRGGGHAAYRGWLQHLFRYAGTRSLRLDTRAVPEDETLLAGDVFLEPGSPGHAVVILDIAEDSSGRRVALLGQGFMPAEDFHVLESRGARGGVWFALPRAGERVETPSWRPFHRRDVRRFSGP